jgi:hypothetical protein
VKRLVVILSLLSTGCSLHLSLKKPLLNSAFINPTEILGIDEQNPLRRVGTGNTPKVDSGVAPTDPSNPSLANGATNVPTSGTITFGGCSGATTITVTGPDSANNPPTTPSNNPAFNSQSYSGLASSTLYRVRVNCSNSFGISANLDFYFTTSTSVPAGVIGLSNIVVKGCFLTYGTDTGNNTTDYPVAALGTGNARNLLQVSGNAHLYRSTQPTLKDCTTPVNSLNVGSFVADLGLLNVNGSDQTPGTSGGIIRGAYVHPVSGEFYTAWSGAYTNLPAGLNTFARFRINGNNTLTRLGCYAYPDTMPITSYGAVKIPDSFVSTYLPAGRSLGLLGGYAASATSGNDYGPGLIAVPVPADNDCLAGQDNLIPAGTVLAKFGRNSDLGTTCHIDDNHDTGFYLGCDTSAKTITSPTPARMAETRVSYDLYNSDWDPKNGKGFFADNAGWRQTIYDDGVLAGMLVPFTTTEGYLKTTVVSTTGPGQVVLASTSTNDGLNLNPKDEIVIKSCIVGTDAGCASANANSYTVATVDTVNTSTKEVTYHSTNLDSCTSCSHAPVVGGAVYGGPIYPHAIPGWMRSTLRLQIIPLSQYAAVAQGASVDSPIYSEETSLVSMGVTALGDPSLGQGIQAGFTPGNQQTVTSVIADEASQEFVVFVKVAQLFGGSVPRSLGIVFSVIH